MVQVTFRLSLKFTGNLEILEHREAARSYLGYICTNKNPQNLERRGYNIRLPYMY